MMARATRAARRLVSVSAALVCFFGVTAMAVLLTPSAAAAPEPSPIPKRWQLEVAPSRLFTASVAGRPYFFMTYRVTNNSPQDLLFAPSFELATDEGDLLRSGRDVPFYVTQEILDRLADPLMEDQISIVGTLLRGPENAQYGVVVWPMPRQHLSEVSVYYAGFSGETATVEVPHPESGRMEKKLLRKTWMMRFRMPGDMDFSGGAAFDPIESRWIMR